MKKWEVYLANVLFEEVPGEKQRPVLILNHSEESIECVKMTGQPPRFGEYVLKDWKSAGLRKPTVVRVSKYLKIESSSIIKKIGTLQLVDIIELRRILG